MEEEPNLSPGDATKKAMAEITAPIIAITLVLLSVFVPIAFIPGISGTLFRQFAVTISAAMLISALNALTLSPALCAVFLRPSGPKRGPMGWVLRRIDNIRDGYAAIVRRLVRVSVLGIVAILASAAGVYFLVLANADRVSAGRGPGRLLYLGTIARWRIGHPHPRCGQAGRGRPEADAAIQNIFAIVGFSIIDGVNESNTAFVVPTLKPFADRVGAANSAQALIARVFAEGRQIRTATVIPFNLPPIIGLSTTGGFEYQLEGLEGQDPAEMNSVMQGLLAAANQDPRLTRVFSTFTASNPSIFLDIDREKAQALGLSMNDVFGALQATLGGIFINNFNLFGRVWQVNIQGEAAEPQRCLLAVADPNSQQVRRERAAALDRRRSRHPRAAGHHPIQQLSRDPDSGRPVSGHILRRRARGNGGDLGQDIAAGYSFEWTGTAYQEVAAPGRQAPSSGLPCCSRFYSSSGSTRAG